MAWYEAAVGAFGADRREKSLGREITDAQSGSPDGFEPAALALVEAHIHGGVVVVAVRIVR